jgi:hypothetical protein
MSVMPFNLSASAANSSVEISSVARPLPAEEGKLRRVR